MLNLTQFLTVKEIADREALGLLDNLVEALREPESNVRDKYVAYLIARYDVMKAKMENLK